MNRNTPPRYGDIRMPVVPAFSSSSLPNGVEMHVLRGGSQPIVKVDILVRAGTLRCDAALVARAVADLMAEGTANHTSSQIANALDFYGASVWSSVTANSCVISMLCLSRDVANVVPLFEEIVKYPTFPKNEVELYRAQELQNFEIGILKSSVNASRLMLKALYADDDRYSRIGCCDDYANNLTTENLLDYHRLAYRPHGARIFVSGQPSDDDLRIISSAFGNNWEGGDEWNAPAPNFLDGVRSKFVNFDGQQTSLRMTRRAFERLHPDFLPMQVVNLALGGYFGSRLMQTLREKLGLTYGVSSYIVSNRLYGLHGISTEIKVGTEHKVIDVIKDEMRRLAAEPIPDSELDGIRAVMLGELLRYFDSVISSAETLFSFVADGIPLSRVEEYYNIIRTISPSEVRDVAARWLEPDMYNIVCVGPMD